MNGHANLYVKWGHKIDYKLCTKYLIDTKHETRKKYMIRYFEIEPNIYIYAYCKVYLSYLLLSDFTHKCRFNYIS